MPIIMQHEADEKNLKAECRMQVGAALLLGCAVLVGVVLRAGIRSVFPAGWWHHW